MNILLVDDEKLIRSALRIILQEEFNIVGEAGNGVEAIKLAEEFHPDLMLLDIRMPEMDGVETAKILSEKFPEIKILILTTFTDIAYIKEAMKYGAMGYLLKDSDKDHIIKGIKSALSGNVVLNREVAEILIKAPTNDESLKTIKEYDLSEKDLKLIELISEGYSNKEIADEVFLQEGTIKNNISVILQKTGLRDRTQLLSFAFKNGLVK